jgi:Rps23 Pro-64 3,4-dihydroxylase Tpa1-like proline 4-hydroxylase
MTVKRSTKEAAPQSTPVLRKKRISIRQTPEEAAQAVKYFQSHVFEPSFTSQIKQSIIDSQPYHWGTIKNLIDDDLLRNVRKEIMSEIEFTRKETDIYKIFQSGDLANLSAMPDELLQRLPSVYKLRSAIYSDTFRNFMSEVTGCGDLSGVKADLSIQLYTKGCHLLTHDDVIGSRRVSFILYMPDPDTKWKSHYGGGLQLFDSLVPNVPKSDVHSKLVPEFNQIAFFQVQPGLSFHAVEEVKVDRQRLSLQGWFHIPQKGEKGFIPGEQERTERKSTLQQLESKELREYDFPKLKLSKISNPISVQDSSLTALDIDYLSQFINPSLLTVESITKLSNIFNEESVVDILSFLNKDYESIFRKQMKNVEMNEFPPMPTSEEAVSLQYPWKLAMPSHKQRYMYMDGTEREDISSPESIAVINQAEDTSNNSNFKLTAQVLRLKNQITDAEYEQSMSENPNSVRNLEISAKLCDLGAMLKSRSFRKWLTEITKLKLMKQQAIIRRFRPGSDFILATKNTKDEDDDTTDSSADFMDGLLEATLNLTPTQGWESGEWGGYELCLIDDEEDDAKKNKPIAVPTKMGKSESGVELNEDEAAIYRTADQDSVVYEGQASWNKFSLMFRDPSVLKFVKYVSFEAPGSRWDINCSWKCVDQNADEDE